MKKIKAAAIVGSLCIFFFGRFVSLAQAEGVKIGLRLTGGMNSLSTGDINKDIQGENDYWKGWHGMTISGEFQKIRYGFDGQADLLIYFTPRFGLSLGSGYILGKKDAGQVTLTSPSDNRSESLINQISAIPILAGLFFIYPISSGSRIFVQAGGGYYFAKYSQSGDYDRTGDINFSEEWTQNAAANGFGFHGGLGFEFDLGRNVAFVIEGFGRRVQIDGFKGDWIHRYSDRDPYTGHGSLYYWEWEGIPNVRMGEEFPSYPDIKNVREAIIDFSGFAIRAGIRIVF